MEEKEFADLPIYKMSAKMIEAEKLKAKGYRAVARVRFPWSKCKSGESFGVPISEVNFNSLRVSINAKSKEGKKFSFFVHSDIGIVEIGRVDGIVEEDGL